MAQVCRLANESAGTTYDFLTGVLSIRFNTWRERPTRDGNIISTFDLIAVDSDANIIAAAEASIGELIEVHELANENDRYRESLWFEYNAASETAKRSLVHKITFYQSPEALAHPLLGKTRAVYKMAITHGVWEDRSATDGGFTGNKAALAGIATIAAIDGSVPARIGFNIKGVDGGGGPIDRVWAGIRPTRYGVSSMVILWELESGTNGTDATDDEIAGASPGTGANNTVVVDFSTNTMINRVGMTVDDAIADSNYSHSIGRYLVLLRYSTETGGDEFVAEMRTGYPNNTTFAPHGEHVLSGTTAWRLEPMGEIQIPSWAFRENTGNLDLVCRDFTIQIHAERTTGSDNLYLDALILIPSEHFMSFEGAEIEYDGFAAEMFVRITEYGEEVALFFDVNQRIKTNIVASFNNFVYPIEGGLLVVAGERIDSSVLSDAVKFAVVWYPRHRNHREA